MFSILGYSILIRALDLLVWVMNLSPVVRYHKFRAVQFCVHICDVLSCFVIIVSFCDVSHDVSVLQEACAKIDEDDGEENNILGWADFFWFHNNSLMLVEMKQ